MNATEPQATMGSQSPQTTAPWATVAHEEDAPTSLRDLTLSKTWVSDTWQRGIEGTPRHVGLGENSMLATFIVAIVVMVTFNVDHCRRLMKSIPQYLGGVRRRDNAFDEHTAGETRTYVLVVMLLCISEGILMLAEGIRCGYSVSPIRLFGTTMALAGLAGGWYLFLLCAYLTVGNTFTDKFSASQWVRGFNASQALLSLLLLLPAMAALIYPASASVILPVAACLYIVTRVLFIQKGFRIFYNKIPSLLYFILYLCALEITPLFIVAGFARSLLSNT